MPGTEVGLEQGISCSYLPYIPVQGMGEHSPNICRDPASLRAEQWDGVKVPELKTWPMYHPVPVPRCLRGTYVGKESGGSLQHVVEPLRSLHSQGK